MWPTLGLVSVFAKLRETTTGGPPRAARFPYNRLIRPALTQAPATGPGAGLACRTATPAATPAGTASRASVIASTSLAPRQKEQQPADTFDTVPGGLDVAVDGRRGDVARPTSRGGDLDHGCSFAQQVEDQRLLAARLWLLPLVARGEQNAIRYNTRLPRGCELFAVVENLPGRQCVYAGLQIGEADLL